MRITYDPTTGEIKDVRLGNHIDCPEGLEEAWVVWPDYALTCKVISVENGWAQVEVLTWSKSLEQLKKDKKEEFLAEMTRESDQIRETYPIFKNPAWGILYEESAGIAAGLLNPADAVLLPKVAQDEGTDLTTIQASVVSQIDSSRIALTAITEKYLSKGEQLNNATTHEEMNNIRWED